MPDVNPSETESEFINRCIPIVIAEGTAQDSDQAYAICQSKWDNRNNPKQMKQKDIKYCDIELKDLNEEKGIVAFYFSAFDTVDSYGDVVVKGAFDKTFSESKSRIKHFRNHDIKEVVGSIMELGTDNRGAYAVSQLALKTVVGKDTYEQYKAGIITEHSFGYQTIKADKREDGGRTLKEVKLLEVSSLTHWGANELTPVIGLKSLDSVVEYMQKLNLLLTHGNISDEKAVQIISEYKNLEKTVSEIQKKTAKKEPANMNLKNIADKFKL